MLCLFPLLYYNILHVLGKKNIVRELWDKHVCGWNSTTINILNVCVNDLYKNVLKSHLKW